jgi:N-acetyl sugar amidotransferase
MICSRCIYSDEIFTITFNENGVCNYCIQIEELCDEYGTKTQAGENKLLKIIGEIKKKGEKNKYDCVIGISGGTDSSYLLMKAYDWGLKPLAVHYDNTWNTAVSTENIRKITSSLNIDLYTHVINNKEHDQIKLAFLKAGVQEFDTDTDLAFVQVLRSAAAKYNIKYILEGHSFMEEGISPIHNNYFDGRYIEDIILKHSNIKIKTYPLMTFFQFLKWIIVYRQKFIRPLWYINYSKKKAQEELQGRTGWLNYDGHHLENRASSFAHQIWIPERFGTDYRILVLAAKVRNGEISRQEALKQFNSPLKKNEKLEKYVIKRLNLTLEEYKEIFRNKKKTWRDFKTYKNRFEKLRFLFYLFAKAKLIPYTFYLKYCFPVK